MNCSEIISLLYLVFLTGYLFGLGFFTSQLAFNLATNIIIKNTTNIECIFITNDGRCI